MADEKRAYFFEEDGKPIVYVRATMSPSREEVWDLQLKYKDNGYEVRLERPPELVEKEEEQAGIAIMDCLKQIKNDAPGAWLKSSTIVDLCLAKGWKSTAQRKETSVSRVMVQEDSEGNSECWVSTGSRRLQRYWLGTLPEEEKTNARRLQRPRVATMEEAIAAGAAGSKRSPGPPPPPPLPPSTRNNLGMPEDEPEG